MDPLFIKNGVMRAKLETTAGTEAAPAASDSILIENFRLQLDPRLTQTDELTGSLDQKAPIPGGMGVSVSFDTYVKGSGVAGTAPEFGDLFKICGFAETGIASIATTSFGSISNTSTEALLVGATTGAQFYRGLPLLVSGPNTGTMMALISNYTTGRIATLDRNLLAAANIDDSFSVPEAVIYRPTSDRSLIRAATLYMYADGLLWKFFGMRGGFTLGLQTGGPGRLSWNLQGIFGGRTDVAKPTDSSFDATRPPVWRNDDSYSSAAYLDRQQIALRQFSFDPQNSIAVPDNPNALEGFDPGVVTGRNLRISIDPLMQLVATRDLIAGLRASSQYILSANFGKTAGNRFALLAPAAQPTGYVPTERDRMWAEQTEFFCDGEDSGASLCFY